MANCTVTIEYLGDGNGGTITSFTNASGEVLNIPTSPSFGGNYFILGVSELGGEDVLGDFGGWIGSENSSVTGVLSNTEININGTNLDHFTLYFDSVAKQWATLISIDGTQYENNDAIFYWEGASADTHKVQLLRWNTPHYPARLTGISTGVSRTYYRTEIKSITRGSELFSDAQQPSYGVLPQYGSIELYDTDGEILYYAQNKMLDKGQKVTIKLDDNIIGKYITDEWDYQYGKNVVKITLEDDLSFLDEKQFVGYNYITSDNAFSLITEMCSRLGLRLTISQETRLHLSYILFGESWVSQNKAREILDNFCKATMTYMVITQNGEISIFSEKELRTAKSIYANSIIGSPKSQLVMDNIIDGVEIKEYTLQRVENTISDTITSVVKHNNIYYATVTNKYNKATDEKENSYFAKSSDGSNWQKASVNFETNSYISEFRNLRKMKKFGNMLFALCDYSAVLYDKTIQPNMLATKRIKNDATLLIYSTDMLNWKVAKGTYGVEEKETEHRPPDASFLWNRANTYSVFSIEDYYITSDGKMYLVGYNYCTNYHYYTVTSGSIGVPPATGATLFGEMVGDWVKKSLSYTTPDFTDGEPFSNGCNNSTYTGSISSFEQFCYQYGNDSSFESRIEEINPGTANSSRCYFGERCTWGTNSDGDIMDYSSKKPSRNIMCYANGDMFFFVTRQKVYSARLDRTLSPIFENFSDPLLNEYIWGFCVDNDGKYYISYESDIADYILRFDYAYATVGSNNYTLFYSHISDNEKNNYGYGLEFFVNTPNGYPQIIMYPKTPIDKGLTFAKNNVYNKSIKRISFEGYENTMWELSNEAFSAFAYFEALETLYVYTVKSVEKTNSNGEKEKNVLTSIISCIGFGFGTNETIEKETFDYFYGADNHIYTVKDNEMIRSSASLRGTNLAYYIANKIISDRKDGLQTVEIECNVKNYNDLLCITDIVIPYIRNNVPFAKYKNGDPKKFLVYSVEYNYNGTHKQNLKMLEVRLNG